MTTSPQPPARCRIEGCPNPHRAKGLCSSHYRRLRRHGDPFADVPLRPTSLVASRKGRS